MGRGEGANGQHLKVRYEWTERGEIKTQADTHEDGGRIRVLRRTEDG